MQLKLDEDRYLYNGILIEAGTSTTDTEQHITIKKLSNLIDEISKLEKSNMGFESDFIVGFGQMGKKIANSLRVNNYGGKNHGFQQVKG